MEPFWVLLSDFLGFYEAKVALLSDFLGFYDVLGNMLQRSVWGRRHGGSAGGRGFRGVYLR